MSDVNAKVYREQGGNTLVVEAADGGAIKGQASAGATPAQAAHIADAETSHALNATFSNTEVQDALDALGAKVNALIAVAENIGATARS